MNGAIYENEQTTKSPDDNVNIFENYDAALCGDIHAQQVLQNYEIEEKEIDERELGGYLKVGWRIKN